MTTGRAIHPEAVQAARHDGRVGMSGMLGMAAWRGAVGVFVCCVGDWRVVSFFCEDRTPPLPLPVAVITPWCCLMVAPCLKVTHCSVGDSGADAQR